MAGHGACLQTHAGTWRGACCDLKAHVLTQAPHRALAAVEGLDGCSDPVSTALIDIEPTTGITMGARQVFVLSTQLEPYNQIDPAVAPSIVPIMEVEVESAITPELARKFRDGLERVWLVRKALVSIVPGVAIALALTGTALVVPWPEGRQRRALGRWERITQAHRASQSASAGPSGAGADGDARGGARVPAVRRGGLAALRQKLGAKILGLRSRSWRRRRNVDLQARMGAQRAMGSSYQRARVAPTVTYAELPRLSLGCICIYQFVSDIVNIRRTHCWMRMRETWSGATMLQRAAGGRARGARLRLRGRAAGPRAAIGTGAASHRGGGAGLGRMGVRARARLRLWGRRRGWEIARDPTGRAEAGGELGRWRGRGRRTTRFCGG